MQQFEYKKVTLCNLYSALFVIIKTLVNIVIK